MAEKSISKFKAFEQAIVKKFFAPKLKQKTNFFRLLALTQRSGLGIRDALVSIKKAEQNEGMLTIIQDLIEHLTEGYTLSEAMENHEYFFQEEDVALTQSAETMGNLAEILEEIAVELENNERINGKIKKALTYPIILGAFAVIAVVILLLYVIPSIVTMFPSPESLPRITKVMMKASAFLGKTWYIIVIVVVSLIGLYKFAYKNILAFKIFVDKIMITMPAVSGVVKGFYMYRFTRLLSQLYNAGVSPTISLKLMGKTFSNFFYRKKVMEIRGNLNAGFGFAESMEGSPLFDPILVQIIHVGEQTGNIAEVLSKMSTFYSDTLQTKIDVLMGMIEPLMMAVIAIIIGVIVASIFLPMADMVNVIM